MLDFVIGKTVEDGEELHCRLTPNLLIVGGAESEKAALIGSILKQLTSYNSPDELKLVIVNNSGGLTSLEKMSHSNPFAINAGEHEAFPILLSSLVEEVEKRHEILIKAKCNSAQKYNQKHPGEMPPVVVVVDDLASIMLKNDPGKMEPKFVRFAQAYQRVSDVHFIICAPSEGDIRKWLTGLMVANYGANVIFLQTTQPANYKIFSEDEDKLVFTGDKDHTGYYRGANTAGRLKHFKIIGY